MNTYERYLGAGVSWMFTRLFGEYIARTLANFRPCYFYLVTTIYTEILQFEEEETLIIDWFPLILIQLNFFAELTVIWHLPKWSKLNSQLSITGNSVFNFPLNFQVQLLMKA